MLTAIKKKLAGNEQTWLLKFVLSSAFWSLLTSVFNRITPLVISLIVARTLGRDLFGEYSMVRGTSSMIGVFAGLGLELTATKEVARCSGDPEKLRRIVQSIGVVASTAGIVGMAILFLSADFIASKFLDAPRLSNLIKISAMMMPFLVLAGAVQGILNGMELYRKSAISNGLLMFVTIPLCYFLIVRWGIDGSIYAIILHSLLSVVALGWVVKISQPKYSLSARLATKRELIGLLFTSLPIMLLQILPTPSFWYARAVLVRSRDGFGEVAIFDAGYQWLSIVMMVTGSVTTIALPLLSRTKSSSQFLSFVKVNIVISSLLVFLFILFSPMICNLYGDDFEGGASVFAIIFISAVPFTMVSLIRNFQLSETRLFWAVLPVCIYCLCLVISSYVIGTNLSAYILAFINVSSWGLSLLVSLIGWYKFRYFSSHSNE